LAQEQTEIGLISTHLYRLDSLLLSKIFNGHFPIKSSFVLKTQITEIQVCSRSQRPEQVSNLLGSTLFVTTITELDVTFAYHNASIARVPPSFFFLSFENQGLPLNLHTSLQTLPLMAHTGQIIC